MISLLKYKFCYEELVRSLLTRRFFISLLARSWLGKSLVKRKNWSRLLKIEKCSIEDSGGT